METSLAYIAAIFVVVAVVVAIGVWVAMKRNLEPESAGAMRQESELPLPNQESAMQPSDWVNAAANVVVGLFLGVSLYYLLELVADGYWPLALLVVLLVAGFFFFYGLLDRILERVFPSGIRPAREPAKKRRLPPARRMSLPVGMLIGCTLAWFDLAGVLLRWL